MLLFAFLPGNLGESVLLFVRISVPGIHSDHRQVKGRESVERPSTLPFSVLLTNLDCHHVFSIVRRRLPLVVEIVYCIRRLCDLHFCLFDLLLLLEGKFVQMETIFVRSRTPCSTFSLKSPNLSRPYST